MSVSSPRKREGPGKTKGLKGKDQREKSRGFFKSGLGEGKKQTPKKKRCKKGGTGGNQSPNIPVGGREGIQTNCPIPSNGKGPRGGGGSSRRHNQKKAASQGPRKGGSTYKVPFCKSVWRAGTLAEGRGETVEVGPTFIKKREGFRGVLLRVRKESKKKRGGGRTFPEILSYHRETCGRGSCGTPFPGKKRVSDFTHWVRKTKMWAPNIGIKKSKRIHFVCPFLAVEGGSAREGRVGGEVNPPRTNNWPCQSWGKSRGREKKKKSTNWLWNEKGWGREAIEFDVDARELWLKLDNKKRGRTS